jgi:hypothetical protein
MAYVNPNFKTRKALVDAVKAGQRVSVFAPGLGSIPLNGEATIEGPHSPEPHRWYATVIITKGYVTKVK